MFERILIANRGEIACRIMRTARAMDVQTIAVHSRADSAALHVAMADGAVEIGPAPAIHSYLDAERIIDAAIRTGAQAVHPGYGFLSENAHFARRCAEEGLVFIGPPPEAIQAMGLKDRAKAIMRQAGVPVVPGYDGEDQNDARLAAEAEAIGYPVLIKASAGGGGKGMRRVASSEAFGDALAAARREAAAAFGNDHVIIEKLIANPRHIEIQIFADAHGNAVHLFERDCSLQRRHQKVIEEAPAPGMTAQVREAMGKAAVTAAHATGYRNAGTVEFIADASEGLRADRFWFMEMNTRLQVEHPITEAITGLDLVEWQLRVAAGEPLAFKQQDIAITGHAIEARLYAEDPARDFMPASGRIACLDLPMDEHIRIDAGVRQGDRVQPFYDPMIAKIIVHGKDREAARERLSHALSRSIVAGVSTNAAWLGRIVRSDVFARGGFDTGVLEGPLADVLAHDGDAASPPGSNMTGDIVPAVQRAGIALYRQLAQRREASRAVQWDSPWTQADGFQLDGLRTFAFSFMLDGQVHSVEIAHGAQGPQLVQASGDAVVDDADILDTDAGMFAFIAGQYRHVAEVDHSQAGHGGDAASGDIRAPMHGRIVSVLVGEGDRVKRGARLAIVEAMKMEHVLAAPFDGDIMSINAIAGAQVAERAILMTLKPVKDD